MNGMAERLLLYGNKYDFRTGGGACSNSVKSYLSECLRIMVAKAFGLCYNFSIALQYYGFNSSIKK